MPILGAVTGRDRDDRTIFYMVLVALSLKQHCWLGTTGSASLDEAAAGFTPVSSATVLRLLCSVSQEGCGTASESERPPPPLQQRGDSPSEQRTEEILRDWQANLL